MESIRLRNIMIQNNNDHYANVFNKFYKYPPCRILGAYSFDRDVTEDLHKLVTKYAGCLSDGVILLTVANPSSGYDRIITVVYTNELSELKRIVLEPSNIFSPTIYTFWK
jgi:hypothetical protein